MSKNDPNADNDAGYTYHYEPARQGGRQYIRCEHCGRESIPAKPPRVLHREDCPLRREVTR